MTQQSAIRHHFVPVSYLRRFADESDRLWMYRPHDPAPRQVGVRDVAVERYLYSPSTSSPASVSVLETALADYVDGPSVAAIDALIAGQPLGAEERERLAVFLAVLEMRGPAARDGALKNLAVPAIVITRSGIVITDSADGDHASERSDGRFVLVSPPVKPRQILTRDPDRLKAGWQQGLWGLWAARPFAPSKGRWETRRHAFSMAPPGSIGRRASARVRSAATIIGACLRHGSDCGARVARAL